ncbi:MAG: type IV secretion system DNA-binding domain-containing protein [Candidatus Spechtbacterales bacterium]
MDINFFAQTTARGRQQKFGIKLDDRRRHVYVIGKTGMGKTQMLQNMAIQDVIAGHGVGIIDPHGEFAEAVLDFVPKNRINDVVYFNPADIDAPIGFNIMESVAAEQRYLIAAGLMAAFKKIWIDVWSARMEYILNNTLLALLEYPNATIMGANRMLADKDYRKKVVDNVKDPAVKSFWINEFARYPERYREEATGAIQNKIGQFISNPLIRNIVGQTRSTFSIRDIMDNKKIFIVNLSKGRIGEDNTALLGTMLITKLQTAAMSRVDTPEEDRKDFFLYIDEFQTFATPSFAGILSEARKYRLALILAHQYITQMDEIVRDAVFGNAGTLVSFRVGAQDAEFMENEFTPSFLPEDLVNLGKYNIAIKLMIDGIASNAFSAITLPPFSKPEESYMDKIMRVSRERFGKARTEIEDKIKRWSGVMERSQSQDSFRPRVDARPASPRRVEAGPASPEYYAECWDCKRSVKLSFKPDERRPIYCRECFNKRKAKVIEKPPRFAPPAPPRNGITIRPVISSSSRKEVDISSLRETLADYGIIEEGKSINF